MDHREMLEKERERRRAQGKPVAPGPADAGLSHHRASEAEPAIRYAREKLFGSPEPPFPSREDPACVQWETDRLQGAGEEDLLMETVRLVSEGTGFDPFAVHTWLLTGERPKLNRMLVSVRAIKRQLPDGTWIRRKYATVEVNAPVERKEFQRAWAPIRRHFHGDDPFEPKRRTPKLTEDDERLITIMEALPKGEATWRDRQEEWRRRFGNPPSEAALRQRWSHYNNHKLPSLTGKEA